jgi:glucokinase
VRVRLSNDVHNAALYGEHKLGAAVGCKHLVGIFLGTGIGGAIIIDGKLYLGATGHAGNIGHYLLQPLGPLAGSDRGGQLDTIASRAAIAGEAAALATKRKAPHLLDSVGTDVKKITSTALADAIEQGDADSRQPLASSARAVRPHALLSDQNSVCCFTAHYSVRFLRRSYRRRLELLRKFLVRSLEHCKLRVYV